MFNFACESTSKPVETSDNKPKMIPWIGVDLDRTAATYDTFKGWDVIGDPIPKTIERIKLWRRMGIEVRILTARVSPFSLSLNDITAEQMTKVIQDWCVKHIGEALPVTPYKDAAMLFFLDDSAVQIVGNTGEAIAGDKSFMPFEQKIKEAAKPECKFNVGDRIMIPENIRDKHRGKHGVIVKINWETRDIAPGVESSAPREYWSCVFKLDDVEGLFSYTDACLVPEPKSL